MTFDIDRITASKEARRRRLAALPYAEKLKILDAMRQRDVDLARTKAQSNTPQKQRREPKP